MILLDSDTFTLHQWGHKRLRQRLEAAPELPAVTLVTQIEALRGRFDAVSKAADGTQLLRAQQGLVRTLEHLALIAVAAATSSPWPRPCRAASSSALTCRGGRSPPARPPRRRWG